VRKLVIVVPIAIVTAAAVAPLVGAQQPASAGVTRPNLRVLQALPEAQLFPLMNLLSDSLGVGCDYCHVQEKPDLTRTPSNVGGWLWDRDDKPAKRTAREMMRMVIDVNASRFNGEPRITCHTCHHGSTQPARLPPLPPPAGSAGSGATPVPLALPTADSLWTSYINAVGRLDTAKPGTGVIISGWDERSEGRYGKVEIVVAGTRYRATVTTPGSTASQGLDGDIGWVTTNNGIVRLSGGELQRLRRIAMRYHPVKERPANLQVVGVERLAGGDVYVATAKIDPVSTWTLYFDIVTGLLRREITTTETLLLPLQEQVEYDDYRDVSGVRMPFRVRTSTGAPYDTTTRTFLQIRRNVAVDDGLFQPPSGPR
jgi:photosynthetic reaction center cytochrome c subunit